MEQNSLLAAIQENIIEILLTAVLAILGWICRRVIRARLRAGLAKIRV